MNNKYSYKISIVLDRLRFCLGRCASYLQGISLFRNYSKFSLAIRKEDQGKTKLQSQQINKVGIKTQKDVLDINYRLQDVPLIFEIFQNEVYHVEYKSNPTEHIVDLGANIGLSSMYFSNTYGPKTSIISVEPSKQNAQLLKLNLKAHPNITIVESAVSNVDGLFSFYDEGLGYNSKLDDEGKSSYMISTISMDTLISDHNIQKIGILKIDIEGAEEILFEGNIDWVKYVNNIIIEIHEAGFVDTLAQLLMRYGLKFVAKKDSVYLYSKR